MLVMVQDDVATCKSCGETKLLSEFDKNNRSKCKDCRRTYDKERMRRFRENNPEYVARGRANALAWNLAHPERAKASDKRYKERNRDQYLAYYGQRAIDKRTIINELKSKPCHDCGQSFPPHVMDFDHVRGKKRFGIAKMQNHSLEAILAEIAKCDLVCANCHRIRTRKRWNARKRVA